MSQWNLLDGDEDESETRQNDPQYGRDGIIFVIDCRNDMFVKDIEFSEDEENLNSAFSVGLQCCREMMINKIQTSGNAVISVMFFRVVKGDETWKHVVEFQTLSQSSAEKIKQLDSIRMSDSHNDFENKYGQASDALLADVLSACVYSFNKCTLKLASKQIVVFTKDDNPDSNSSDRQHKIHKRANDLSEAGIELELIPIGSTFNIELFYKEILQIANKHYREPLQVTVGTSFWDIMDTITKDSFKKRTQARLKFNIGEDLSISVGLYRFTCTQQNLKKVNLSRQTNEPVRSAVQYLDEETGSVLRPYETLKTVDVGSKQVSFSNDEYSKMRKMFYPGITLLGFKSKNCMKLSYHCSAPFFIFPEESILKGSSQLFIALLSRCIAKNVFALCIMVSRVNSRPKYVLLEPQEEICDENNLLVLPGGFLVHTLPFSRMFSEMPTIPDNSSEIDTNKLSIVAKLIKKLKIKKFESEYFENPFFEKQWISIEALALHQAEPKEFVDTTVEHFERLDNRLKDVRDEFLNTFFSEGDTSHTTKRKAGQTNDIPVKIPKMSEIVDLAAQRKVDKLTIVQLKEILKSVPNIRTTNTMKKNDLVQLIYSNIELIEKYL